MAFLTSSQRAALRAAITTDETTVDQYRNPAPVGGKTSAPVLIAVAIPIRIRPAGDAPKLVALAAPLNAARVSHAGKVAAGTDIRTGDELRQDARSYRVEGAGCWTNAVLVALSEIKGARP